MRSWPCQLRSAAPLGPAIGDMWFARHVTTLPLFAQRELLSDWYFLHNSHRPPVIVCLPDRSEWCVDSRMNWAVSPPCEGGWEVTGMPPSLTVVPAIRMLTWQGRLTDGVLTTLQNGQPFIGA